MSGLLRLAILSLLFAHATAYGQNQNLLTDSQGWRDGKKHLAEGRTGKAKSLFEALLQQYPEEPQLHLVLGLASLKLGDYGAAKLHVQRAVALAPDDVEALTLLGWLQLEIEQEIAAAIASYERVVALRPGLAEAHNNLGVALRTNGEVDRATQSFTRAIELRADYNEALSNRGWIYVQQGDWRNAREDFDKALEVDPADPGALYGLSRVYRELRDYESSQRLLRRLMSESGNFVYWLEWAQVGLVRYYWVFLAMAIGMLLYFRYRRKVRVESNGS